MNPRLSRTSRQALLELACRHTASLQPIGRKPADVRTEHGNGGWSNPRNPQGLSERVGLDLSQALGRLF
jgi:hypothetical protein